MTQSHQTSPAARWLFVATFVPFCWLAMQAVHEFGHFIAAVATGGDVNRVVLHPLTISRTDLGSNPHPLFTVWAGPIIGVLLPLVLLTAWQTMRGPSLPGWRFFAGFCAIANGAYVGFGSIDGVGDCGEMLRHGRPVWTLWLFGLGATAMGFWLWHGLGPRFGLGPGGAVIRNRTAAWTAGGLVAVVAVELLLSPT